MYGYLATPLRKLYHELGLAKSQYATLSVIPELNKKQKQELEKAVDDLSLLTRITQLYEVDPFLAFFTTV